MDFLIFMGPPVVMCLVLVGLHVQLGLHVVRRGVIFVDIAMAQSSALGAAVGVLLGAEVGTWTSGMFGLAAAILAAWVISLTRGRSRTVPQEAFIGITYVVAAAASILVLTNVPHGAEETEALLVGSILWVTWPQVLKTILIYILPSTFLYVYRNKFRFVTENPEEARDQGINLRLWDFLFYGVVGFTVSYSVQIAGVFMVFSFLVVPAVMANLLRVKHQLAVGWALGSVISVIGAVLSYLLDLPTGATIVCTFGVFLVGMWPLEILMRSRNGEAGLSGRA